jgi:hypothetical protein
MYIIYGLVDMYILHGSTSLPSCSSIDMYSNDVGKRFMK